VADTLPPAVVEPLTDLALNALRANGGGHDRAELLLRYNNPTKPSSAITDGSLRAVDPTTGRPGMWNNYKIRFPDSVAAARTQWDVQRRALEAGVPIRTLHYAFDRVGGDWRHRLAVETLADWSSLRTELRPIRTRIETALVPQLTDDWTEIDLYRQADPPKPDRFGVRVGNTRRADQPPPTAQTALDNLAALLDARRRRLSSVRININGERDDWKSAVDLSYGLRPDLV
jgi:hypothetical protein